MTSGKRKEGTRCWDSCAQGQAKRREGHGPEVPLDQGDRGLVVPCAGVGSGKIGAKPGKCAGLTGIGEDRKGQTTRQSGDKSDKGQEEAGMKGGGKKGWGRERMPFGNQDAVIT